MKKEDKLLKTITELKRIVKRLLSLGYYEQAQKLTEITQEIETIWKLNKE